MKHILVILGLLALTACSHSLGYAGAHPGSVACQGKATISFNGAAGASAGIGGTELNGGSIIFDCGNGASLTQGMPGETQPVVPPVKQ